MFQDLSDTSPDFASKTFFAVLDPGDPTLKKVLTRCQDLSDIHPDFAFKTFFGVGSLEIQGSLRFRDPTRKKVLTRCQDLSDIGADFAYKTFFRVGSLVIRGSNPEASLDTLPRPI